MSSRWGLIRFGRSVTGPVRSLNSRSATSSRWYIASAAHPESFGSMGHNSNNSSSRIASSPRTTILIQRMAYSNSAGFLKDYPSHTLYPMPALSPTMEVGSISKWLIEEGDEFGAGDALCSIDTDKASVDFEAQDDGILAKILREGSNAEDIPVGTPICVVVEEAEDVEAFKDFKAEDAAVGDASASEAPPSSDSSSSVSSDDSTAAPAVDSEFILMPSARHLSQSKGLDATGLTGTGKGGRITKGDVLQAIASGVQLPPLKDKATAAPAAPAVAAAAPAAPAAAPSPSLPLQDLPLPEIDSHGSYEDVPNNKMRKVIASRLTESKRDVPHFYTSMEVSLDNILALRKKLVKDHDVKVSVNDIIIRCAALALRDVPEVNATYDAKSKKCTVQDTVDVSVAVATPTGLITPILPNTDQLGLSGISDKVKDLAVRARDGKLKPEEYQGGTFCISNLGMFGITEFSAVINPPQAAILAVGGGTPTIVPTPFVDGAEEQKKPTIQTIMTGRLSADRRVVDEATASLFMAAFRRYMTEPQLLLL